MIAYSSFSFFVLHELFLTQRLYFSEKPEVTQCLCSSLWQKKKGPWQGRAPPTTVRAARSFRKHKTAFRTADR